MRIPLDSPMSSKRKHAREVQCQIRQILLHDWDPVGVQDEPNARDEYDSYVGDVYGLLARGASPKQVAEHLARIEADRMGLPSSVEARLPVATKLCALDVRS